ncbi:MAG: PEP-CTERM sorting domain-containing protein [Planctomycetota bacterium]
MVHRTFCIVLAGFISLASLPVRGQTAVVPVEADFFSTAWAFGAPFLRDAGRTSLGVTTPDPFLQAAGSGSPLGTWEEVTYFTFDFQPGSFTSPIRTALLEVETLSRPFGSIPTPSNPFAVSAHRVTADPTAIDPALNASSAGPSYLNFGASEIAGAEDTVSITDVGIYTWDVTELVEEWIANGDANFDFSLAMTGRIGNPADTASSGFFHAFANSGANSGQAAQLLITSVPEPTSFASLCVLGGMTALRRRRS